MDIRRAVAIAFASFAAQGGAAPGDFSVVVDAPKESIEEESALHGIALLRESASRTMGVGVVGRAFSLSSRADNTVWGVVTEAINFPAARGNVVGLETAVVNMGHDNVSQLRGIDVVFKNRMDVSFPDAVPEVGANRFNENSAAVFVSSQPRSPAGEYSGWQAGIKFAAASLDRSASRPYAAAIDVSEVEVSAPLYLIVWRCGSVKCGLAATPSGASIVHDIEGK